MAISDMKGTVTTTGMMDKGPTMPKMLLRKMLDKRMQLG